MKGLFESQLILAHIHIPQSSANLSPYCVSEFDIVVLDAASHPLASDVYYYQLVATVALRAERLLLFTHRDSRPWPQSGP